MYIDNALLLSSAQAITSTAASSTIYDVFGAGSGNAVNQSYGNALNASLVPGADPFNGQGVGQPHLYMAVTTAFVSAGGATLSVQFQYAPSSSNSPGSYITLYQSQLFTVAQLVAGAVLVAPIPPIAPIEAGTSLPRFYRLNYVVGTSTFSAGNVNAGITLNVDTSLISTLYPANFVAP